MSTATITSKGQITIPIAVRKALGLSAGDRVEFVELPDGNYELVPTTRSVTALKGFFGAPPARPVSVEEMNRAIAESAAEANR
ncbi:AbrB/MazE/SpoVT family DNA-binding domain-containing protein [Isoptericola hypogeus]|uniref:AbrB/MazE/SpoVT family DNA-binding domain-containing protein n=1 Tax=Isoptericola hypogeus TaxID=300179 RepID=A0ABN2JH97_9MICO